MKQLSLTMLLILLSLSTTHAQFAGGSGTEGDPYQVATVEQLQEIRNHTYKHFIQIADIDASDTQDWNDGKGFEPIGDEVIPFTGSFDGNGHEISDLTIMRPDDFPVGLFGMIRYATLVNVELKNMAVSGLVNVGGLVGYNKDSSIIGSNTSGEVSGSGSVGGMIGRNSGANVRNSYAIGTVTTTGNNVGGLVGYNNNSSIIGSYAKVDVSGDIQVGGLIGRDVSGNVVSSYAIGNVYGNTIIGGLMGRNSRSIVSGSYAVGNVQGEYDVGGLVGVNILDAEIHQSYSIGEVNGIDGIGGFVGRNESTISSSYWDIEKSAISQGIGSGTDDGVIGLTTDQMTGLAAQENMDKLDFNDVWNLTIGYPVFNWQEVEITHVLVSLFSPVNEQDKISVTPDFIWQGYKSADEYQLQLSEFDDFSSLLIDIVISDTIYDLDEILEAETTYYWRVKALNDSGESEWSENWSFITFNIPNIVTLQTPVNNMLVTRESLQVIWNSSEPGVENYHIQLSTDSDFSAPEIDSSVSDTTFTLSGLKNQQQYWWRVRAENQAGEGSYSDANTFYVTHSFVQTSGEIVSGVSQFTDEIFFTSSKDDRVYSFDNHGNILWIFETGGELQSTVSVDENGNMYVGSTDTRLYSFDSDGLPRWDRALGGTIRSSPSISRDSIVYVGISTGRFFALSSEDGNLLWSIQTGDEINSSASIDSLGNVYFGSNDGKLYAIDNEGETLWTFESESAIVGSPALTIDGDVVIPSTDGSLYKVNSEGELLWRFDTEGEIRTSPVIDSEGVIYFGSTDGTVYARDKDGLPVWEYQTGSSVNGTPALSQDGVLGIGTDDGRFLLFNQDGELIRYLKTENEVVASALITDDSSIFISGKDGYVYIIDDLIPEISSKLLTNNNAEIHQWATFKGNNQRTGSQSNNIADDDIEELASEIPEQITLKQNYPNPFNPSTIIEFGLPEESEVMLEVFNVLGQRITILVNGQRDEGWHQVTFDASGLSNGAFIYRIEAGEYVETRSMMLLK